MPSYQTLIQTMVFLCLSSTATVLQQATKPDFSDEWNFVAGRSKLQIPVPDSGVFRLDHREPVLRLSRTLVSKGKSDTWSIDLTTDGQEAVQHGSSETTRGRLYWDGNDLIFDSKIILKDREATTIVRYHLSDGGRTLTATESFRGPVVKYDHVWVFEMLKCCARTSSGTMRLFSLHIAVMCK